MSLEDFARELSTVKWEKKKRPTLRFVHVIRKRVSNGR